MKHQKTVLLKDLQRLMGKHRGRKQYMKIVRRQDKSQDRGKVVRTNGKLLSAFFWAISPEGHHYWDEIEQMKDPKI